MSILEEIIPVVIRTLGEEHVDTSFIKSNLARAYARCRRWNKAEAIFSTLVTTISSNHPDWITAMLGYIHARTQQGRLEETESDCEKILNVIIQIKLLPLDDLQTLAIAEQLFKIYHSQARPERIAALQRRVPSMKGYDGAKEGRLAMLFRSNADRESQSRNMFY